jgi:NAD(P)-dependent dehydrogenase (short-subunit alcohol dehydrogenase family)
MQFAGKVVLVTGAQQGIGRAMALELGGADVVINWQRSTSDPSKSGARGIQRGCRHYFAARGRVAANPSPTSTLPRISSRSAAWPDSGKTIDWRVWAIKGAYQHYPITVASPSREEYWN